MAVKAGTAYVGIEGDFSALNKAVSGQAGKVFGSKLGKDFTTGFQQGTSGMGGDLGKQAAKGKSQMSAAGRSMGNEFASSFKASTRNIGQSLSANIKQTATRGIKAAAVGIGGAFVYTVKTAADFEKQMSSLGSVADASRKQMKAFEKQALSAGAKTKFSAKEAAQAQTELAKGGLSVKEILSGGLNAALGLAAAGEMDLADAAATTVNAMKLFNIRGKDSTKVADAFATAANATTADVKDFANALSQGGSAAKTAGLTFESTTAWLEALASSGIKGSDAGTSLKTALLQLASPTLKANGVMKDLGLSFFDAHGNIKSVVEISDMLRKGMGGLTKEQRIQAATTLAGSDGMRGLLALYDAGPTKMRKYEDGLKKQGTAADVAKKKQDNLAGAMENLGGSVETLAIQVGTGMLPGLRKGTEQLTLFANDVGKIFQNKDLDFGEKVNAAIARAKIRFGPMAAEIQQAIRDAHLDDKLAAAIEWATPKILKVVKKVGLESANVFWDGFKAAPVWAQVGGGVWLANKLGLASPAMKGLFNALTGKGAGGGLLGNKPIPVFVTNPGGLPGGGGGGVPVPGGPAGKLGKLKPLMKLGGKLGLAGAALDLGINLLDSKGNPIQALQNSAHDLTFGIVPSFKGAAEKAGEKVGKLKLKLDTDVQTQLPADFDAKAAKLQQEMDKRLLAIKSRNQGAAPALAMSAPGSQGPIVAQLQKANAADVARVAQLGTQLGNTVATAYTTAINSHSQFFGANQLTKGFTAELQKLPEQARQGAYNTMINWANTLVQQGRLPRDAFNSLVRNIEGKMGLLPEGIKRSAKGSIDNLTAQFRRRDMVTAADSMFQALKRKYGEMPELGKTTGRNMTTNFLSSIRFLREGAMNETGKLQRQSSKDLKKTRDDALKYSGDMEHGFNQDLKDMGIKGSKSAARTRDLIVTAFNEMATGTGEASASSASTLYSALGNMGENGQAILKALGIEAPRFTLKRPGLAPAGPGSKEMRPTQRGGHINEGAPSGDSVPAILERDEYVLNRRAVKKVGVAALDRLNFGDAPRFQRGGSVTGDTDFLPALMKALQGLSAAVGQSIFVQSGRRTVAEQLAQGPSTPSHPVAGPNGPHVRGVAADITPGYPVFGSKAGRFGLGFTVMPQEPWHIQLIDAAAAATATVAQKLDPIDIVGPEGILQNTAQGVVDQARTGYNKYIADQFASMVPGLGESFPSGGASGGAGALSKAQIAGLWRQAGGDPGVANLMAAIALAESGGIPSRNNADRPGDGGRHIAAGLWQILGLPFEGNVYNPLVNAKMAVSKYKSQGLGAWEAYTKGTYRQYLQEGGVVGALLSHFQTGGASAAAKKKPLLPWQDRFGTGKKKTAKAPEIKSKWWDNKWFKKLKDHTKKHKPSSHSTLNAIDKLGDTGAYGEVVMAQLGEHSNWVDIYADWAARANAILPTEQLQEALNAQMAALIADAGARGQKVDYSEAGLLKLFPADQQSAFMDAWMRNPANGALVNGGIQVDWLNAELARLYQWRNLLIDNSVGLGGQPSVFDNYLSGAVDAYKKIKAELALIVSDIKKYTDLRAKAVKRRQDAQKKIVELQKKKAKELHDKKKGYAGRVKTIDKSIHTQRVKRNDAERDVAAYNNRLSILKGAKTNAQDNARILGGDAGGPDDNGEGSDGRIYKFREAITSMATNLSSVHGLGTTNQKFWSENEYPLGLLGGTILSVQTDKLGLSANPPRATADEPPATDETVAPGEERTKELLAQLLREQSQRLAVSDLQYEVFRGMPFGGTFKEGGTVPGPVGAPRMIMAHGGEYVVPNDGNMGTNVSVNFANGMEWLKQFVDIRVEDQTRTQGRRGERQLPGRPGLLR
jgi:TP901 family phage tail tape measure protein